MNPVPPRASATIAAAYSTQRIGRGTHFDSQRARDRNKSLITMPFYTREPVGTITRTEPDEVYFATDSTTHLKDIPRNIPEKVCRLTAKLPSVTAYLKRSEDESEEDVDYTRFYKKCSMNEVYEMPKTHVRSCSLKVGRADVTEQPRKRIGGSDDTLFDSTGLDTWVKNKSHTRQIEPWEQQNDLYCFNKHLPHACFPKEYRRLLGHTRTSTTALLSHEWAKVRALQKINADHRDVLTRMEHARSKGVHGFADTRIPGQLKALQTMQEDTSIPIRDAYYYYGFHPLPVESAEEHYRTRSITSTASEIGKSPGVFLWSSQRLRV